MQPRNGTDNYRVEGDGKGSRKLSRHPANSAGIDGAQWLISNWSAVFFSSPLREYEGGTRGREEEKLMGG